MHSEIIKNFEQLFIKTMNLSTSTDLSSVKYGAPANWDSIRHVELFIYLQRDFGVSFSAHEIVKLNTYLLVKQAFTEKMESR